MVWVKKEQFLFIKIRTVLNFMTYQQKLKYNDKYLEENESIYCLEEFCKLIKIDVIAKKLETRGQGAHIVGNGLDSQINFYFINSLNVFNY